MKILYIITSMGHGRGGHFHSCKSIAENYHKLNSQGDTIDICNIGKTKSPVIESSLLKKFYIDIPKKGFFKSLNIFIRIVKKGDYDLLHAFDNTSFAFASTASFLLKKGCILTKCGGPNPKRYPWPPNMVVFSRENYDFFKKIKKYKTTRFFLSPNRVAEESQDKNTINVNKEKERLDLNDSTILLRIARIGETYLESSIKIIEDFQKSYKKFPNLRLLFIGAIESREAYNKLTKSIKEANRYIQNEAIIIKVSDYYTLVASKYISLADIVIATGRGVMEAMAEARPVFIVLDNKEIVLLTEDTISEISYYNYSGRTSDSLNDHFKKYSIENILPKLIKEREYLNKIEKFSISYFKENLLFDAVVKDYEEIYRIVKDSSYKLKPFDWLFSLIIAYRAFKRSYE